MTYRRFFTSVLTAAFLSLFLGSRVHADCSYYNNTSDYMVVVTDDAYDSWDGYSAQHQDTYITDIVAPGGSIYYQDQFCEDNNDPYAYHEDSYSLYNYYSARPWANISADSTSIYLGTSTGIHADFDAGTDLLNTNIDCPEGTPAGPEQDGSAQSHRDHTFTPSTIGSFTFYARVNTQYYSWASYGTVTVSVADPTPTTTISASVGSANALSPFTVTATTSSTGNDVTWQEIDYSTNGGSTWVNGSTGSSTAWSGGQTASNTLTSTFAFNWSGTVQFRARGQSAYGTWSSYGYTSVTIVNHAPSTTIGANPNPITLGLGTTVTATSTDTDGNLASQSISYQAPGGSTWTTSATWSGGPTGSHSLAWAAPASVLTSAGSWQVRGSASDGFAASNVPTVTVTVSKATPVVSNWPNNVGIPNRTGYTVPTSRLTATYSNPYSSAVVQPVTSSITYQYSSQTRSYTGTITPNVTVLPPDIYTITATYPVDSNYNSQSAPVTWVIDDPVTTIEADFINLPPGQTPSSIITNQSATIYFGQSATIKADSQDSAGLLNSQTIDYQPPGAGWTNGSSAAGTAWSGGPTGEHVLTWTIPFSVLNQIGTWNIRASGTDNVRTSDQAPLTINLAKATPASSWLNRTFPTTHHVSATNDLNASFTNPYTSSVARPSGAITYTFVSGATGTVTDGMTLYPGTYTIQASCAPDTYYNGATTTVTWTINNTPPTVSLSTSSTANVGPGQSVAITATANDVDGNLSSLTIDYRTPGSATWINGATWSGGPAGSHTLTWSLPISASGIWQARTVAGDGIATTTSTTSITVAPGVTGSSGLDLFRPPQ